MKKISWFGLLMCLVLTLAAELSAAETAWQKIVPMAAVEDGPNLENGTFCLTIEDTDQIVKSGYFTALPVVIISIVFKLIIIINIIIIITVV